MAVRFKKILQTAADILSTYSDGTTPVNIEAIAKHLGISVFKSPGPDDLSGYIARNPSTGAVVIGVNSCQAEQRQRFTIAHELGHYLLHKGVEVHVDHTGGMPMTYMMNLRGQRASEGTDDEEREANCFAAEILMPASFIKEDMSKLRGVDLLDDSTIIKDLADKYGVSTQAFGYRLANLHLSS